MGSLRKLWERGKIVRDCRPVTGTFNLSPSMKGSENQMPFHPFPESAGTILGELQYRLPIEACENHASPS